MEIEYIDNLIIKLKSLKQSIKKIDKLTEKSMNMNFYDNTKRQRWKINAELDFECINREKIKTDIARLFNNSFLDVWIEKKVYKPNWFQEYIH